MYSLRFKYIFIDCDRVYIDGYTITLRLSFVVNTKTDKNNLEMRKSYVLWPKSRS